MFVDIHTYSKAIETDVVSVLNLTLSDVGVALKSNELGCFSLGVHPWDVHQTSVDVVAELKKHMRNNRLVLIGECGLDKNAKADLEKQIDVFEKHIAVSEYTQKPLLIHCVACYNELLDLKKKWKPSQTWIVHGFRGKPQLAEQLLKQDIRLSFGEKYNPESVKITPIDALFVETDESLLPIKMVYKQLAELKNCDVLELSAGRKLLKV